MAGFFICYIIKDMDNKFLEGYYEKIILPLYKDESIKVSAWKDHGRVGPDNWAHCFEDAAGIEYVLLNEDYPDGQYLDNPPTHDVVPLPDSDTISLKVSFGDAWIPNVTGYFTLYREKGVLPETRTTGNTRLQHGSDDS